MTKTHYRAAMHLEKQKYAIKYEGIQLKETQAKALEAIQKIYDKTDYKGNIEPINPKLPNFRYVPKLRFTQKEYLENYGANFNSRNDRDRSIEVLESLSTHNYDIKYDRLAYDDNGKPILEHGKYKKEYVSETITLIRLKKVYHDTARKRLNYYEIEPHPIFIDQIGMEKYDRRNLGSYFLLKPYNWRDELKEYSGGKISRYVPDFINWLMIQAEERRRSKGGYTIKMNWQVIARQLKMSEVSITRNKSQVRETLEHAYTAAKDLGYLINYSTGDEDVDEIILNPDRFNGKG